MADIRTSHTATPLRGFAAMPKAKHLEAATRGGKTRGAQQTRAAGLCPRHLVKYLHVLAKRSMVVSARSDLVNAAINAEHAVRLEELGLATMRTRNIYSHYITITARGRRAFKEAT
jgi:hypothetical protein